MFLRVAFFVLMALGLVGFGTVAWMTLQAPQPAPVVVAAAPAPEAAPAPAPVVPAPEPPPPVLPKVVVASRTLATGTLLKPDDIDGRPVSSADAKNAISADSQDALRLLVGSMVRRAMAAGQPIRQEDLMKPGEHGFMAAALQPGMRAVTIGVDAASGAAGLVWPGDRVDLILTQTLTDPALPIGSRVAADTILTNTRVIAIDQQLVQGTSPSTSTAGAPENPASTVTLEVTPTQAQRVSVAMRLGRLSLSVRSSEAGPHNDATTQGGSVYARDVSSALGAEPAPAPKKSIHIFNGAGEAKEYKY